MNSIPHPAAVYQLFGADQGGIGDLFSTHQAGYLVDVFFIREWDNFGDWASGKAADFAATTTDPIQLPLAESESEATYKVRVVGPGIAGVNRDFDTMSSAEEEKFIELHIETFLIDFFLPLFRDLKGHEGLLKKANLSEQAVEDLRKIVEPALASTPAVYNKIKEGKFTEAMSDYMNAFHVNAAGSGMKDMLINILEFFRTKFSPDRYIQKRKS